MRRIIFTLAAVLGFVSFAHAKDPGLVIHEWGTFTSLQDETGRALGAINEDVELLPDFVHRLVPDEGGPKGYPTSPAVTMRLETPVVYFHLPQGSKLMSLNFSAEFHGGLLTQFYPLAKTNVGERLPKIDSSTVGKIEWNNITIGGDDARVPLTASNVWLAPRKVNALNVTAENGEAEGYLFYRGVGQLDAPMKVIRSGEQLRINAPADITQIWYFDVRNNGQCAWRKLDTANQDKPGVVTAANFESSEYSDKNLAAMREDMKASLRSAGLFEDEATAMLNTWDTSYFRTPGTRVFFVVPRHWVDEHLPINVSVPARIERVMVGRIDLVTPKHHDLAKMYLNQADKDAPQAQTILSAMGRFGKAIVADEMARVQLPAPAAARAAAMN